MKLMDELPAGSCDAKQNRRNFILKAALLFALALIAYWPAFRGEFIWDDALVIQKNPLVTGRYNLFSIWFHADFPLSMVGFWLEWLVWGKNSAGYHVANILLHGFGAFLLWPVLRRLKIPGCWFAAAIFAVHPVCAASVAWISELKNTLSLPLFLLSIYLYLRSQENSRETGTEASGATPGASRAFYWLSLVSFLLALLAKTSTVMLPVVLLGCAWWLRGKLTRQDWLRASPYFALAIGFGLLSIWFQSHQAFTTATVQTEKFWGRLAGAGMAFWFYLKKAVFPFGLCMIYPRGTVNSASVGSYIPLVLACVMFGVFWFFRRTWGRPLLFGFGYFTVTLFPVLGFFNFYYLAISRVSDHLEYLSLIGIIALVVGLAARALPKNILALVVTIVVAVFGFLSMQRAHVMAKDETLWRNTLAKNPGSWTAHNNLGCILAEQNKLGEAILQFIQSLQTNPQNGQAHCNLGKAFSLQNNFAEAEAQFKMALQLNPNSADINRSFAGVLIEEGKNQEALAQFKEALRLEPDAGTRLELARLLHQMGRVQETIEQYRAVLSVKPDSFEALNNLAWILATSADPKLRNGLQAVRYAERACRLTHYREMMPLGTLAAAYAEAGQFGEAIKAAEKSLQLAETAGDRQAAAMNREFLKLYRSGRPYHEQAAPKPK